MQSAYVKCTGKDPLYTNLCASGNGSMFKEVLDYIFVSQEVNVESVLEVKESDRLQPNLDEPSDHVLIAANISFPSKV